MPIWPVSFSLMASFMSAITLLGVSNENYQFGTQFVVINMSYGLSTPIAAYLFLPVFYKLQVDISWRHHLLFMGNYYCIFFLGLQRL
jgi:sodium-coupled monocarboxylate transporter 8/12